MIVIRNGVFETNSSSTHVIAVPNHCSGNSVYFYFDSFGWEFEEYSGAPYFYTAVYEIYSKEKADKIMQRVFDLLEERGIKYEVLNENFNDQYYIDHAEDLHDFIEGLLNDDDSLINFIVDGVVYTGNDNSDQQIDYSEVNTDDYTLHYKGN